MEICGEHGNSVSDEIAHQGRDCPACNHIEELKKDHEAEVENLNNQIECLETEVSTLQDDVEALESELEEARVHLCD